jgi:hypothetical protein
VAGTVRPEGTIRGPEALKLVRYWYDIGIAWRSIGLGSRAVAQPVTYGRAEGARSREWSPRREESKRPFRESVPLLAAKHACPRPANRSGDCHRASSPSFSQKVPVGPSLPMVAMRTMTAAPISTG